MQKNDNFSLFDEPENSTPRPPDRQAPLAERMRPRTVQEFIGQEHILAEG